MKKHKSNSHVLPADGKWHTLVEHSVEGPSAFEINGYSQGQKGHGAYSVIHAIALNFYSGKRGRIQSCCDFYGWIWWRRLKLRWIGSTYNYKLQIKTCSNYGRESRIVVHVKNLLNYEFEHIKLT